MTQWQGKLVVVMGTALMSISSMHVYAANNTTHQVKTTKHTAKTTHSSKVAQHKTVAQVIPKHTATKPIMLAEAVPVKKYPQTPGEVKATDAALADAPMPNAVSDNASGDVKGNDIPATDIIDDTADNSAPSTYTYTSPYHYVPPNPEDPYEPFNRVMFTFNDWVDKLVLKPVATVYNAVFPKPVTKCFSNFYSNIDNVPTIINDVLQFNFYQATSDTWRLLINSTVGILGLFDVATHIGLEPNSEDFGLTLARWGYEKSNYLVLPFLGPQTVRDAISWPINYQYMTIYPAINPISARYQLYTAGIVVRRAELLRYQDVFQQATLDKYVFMRNAYMQRRAYLIERNKQLGDPYLNKTSLENPSA